jgi:iron complex transport system permease protein
MGILLFCDPNQRLKFVWWGMGKVPDSTPGAVLALCAACVAGGWFVLLLRGAAFNSLGLGDEVAASSGVRVHWLRTETFAVVGLMTAAAVGLAGPIGFLGLIVPHICRMIFGPDHRRLVLVSGFTGAVLLMIADTLGRTCGAWFNVGDIPVGVITAMCGGPFFIWLLRRRFREIGG